MEKFFLTNSNHQLSQANAMVVFLKKIKIENNSEERIFALTFGRGKSLFKEMYLKSNLG